MKITTLLGIATIFVLAAGCAPGGEPMNESDAVGRVVPKDQGFGGDRVDPGLFVVGISHLNVVVEDIEYATEFYRRTLGFEQAHNERGIMDYPNVTRPSFARDAGFMDGKVDFHIRFPKHPTAGIYLELMTYRYPLGAADIVFRNTNDMGGIRHVALEVSDAERVFDYLNKQPGVRMINESPSYRPEELTPVKIKFFYWLDPWGVQWEMEEGRPVGSARGIVG